MKETKSSAVIKIVIPSRERLPEAVKAFQAEMAKLIDPQVAQKTALHEQAHVLGGSISPRGGLLEATINSGKLESACYDPNKNKRITCKEEIQILSAPKRLNGEKPGPLHWDEIATRAVQKIMKKCPHRKLCKGRIYCPLSSPR